MHKTVVSTIEIESRRFYKPERYAHRLTSMWDIVIVYG